jgi:hypothetical protein
MLHENGRMNLAYFPILNTRARTVHSTLAKRDAEYRQAVRERAREELAQIPSLPFPVGTTPKYAEEVRIWLRVRLVWSLVAAEMYAPLPQDGRGAAEHATECQSWLRLFLQHGTPTVDPEERHVVLMWLRDRIHAAHEVMLTTLPAEGEGLTLKRLGVPRYHAVAKLDPVRYERLGAAYEEWLGCTPEQLKALKHARTLARVAEYRDRKPGKVPHHFVMGQPVAFALGDEIKRARVMRVRGQQLLLRDENGNDFRFTIPELRDLAVANH